MKKENIHLTIFLDKFGSQKEAGDPKGSDLWPCGNTVHCLNSPCLNSTDLFKKNPFFLIVRIRSPPAVPSIIIFGK